MVILQTGFQIIPNEKQPLFHIFFLEDIAWTINSIFIIIFVLGK